MKGLTTAPLCKGDAEEVASVWRTCELHDDGRVQATVEDYVAVTSRPSMVLERDTIGVRDGDALVAVAFLYGERQAFAHVLPSHRGRGIGTWLLDWTERMGRAVGRTRSCQTISENAHAARALLEAACYERGWEDWTFAIELAREPDPPLLPDGYELRAFERERDERAVHRVIEDAFGEWPDAGAEDTFDDWAAQTYERPGFRPEHVAPVLRDGEIVGVASLIAEEDEIWVAQLAVAREHRGRGLARALLLHAFGVAWRSGRRRCGLGTDSRTGARGLYEHVGMQVTRTAWEYAKLL